MINTYHEALTFTKAIQKDIDENLLPQDDIAPSHSQLVIPFALVRKTRGYIEKLVHQINGCYENAWYDACAVIIRRLVEVLIIEVYEKYGEKDKIIDTNTGNPYFLEKLIEILLIDRWQIGRNAKEGFPKVKKLGDKSAHNRRYNALRHDIDNVKGPLRDIVDELINLAQLK